MSELYKLTSFEMHHIWSYEVFKGAGIRLFLEASGVLKDMADNKVAVSAQVRDVKIGPDGAVYVVTDGRGGASQNSAPDQTAVIGQAGVCDKDL